MIDYLFVSVFLKMIDLLLGFEIGFMILFVCVIRRVSSLVNGNNSIIHLLEQFGEW